MLHDHVTVLCTASGNPPLLLTKWYKDSIVVGNLGRLYIRDVDLTKAGRYVCKAAIGKLIKETSIEITVNCKYHAGYIIFITITRKAMEIRALNFRK